MTSGLRQHPVRTSAEDGKHCPGLIVRSTCETTWLWPRAKGALHSETGHLKWWCVQYSVCCGRTRQGKCPLINVWRCDVTERPLDGSPWPSMVDWSLSVSLWLSLSLSLCLSVSLSLSLWQLSFLKACWSVFKLNYFQGLCPDQRTSPVSRSYISYIP